MHTLELELLMAGRDYGCKDSSDASFDVVIYFWIV